MINKLNNYLDRFSCWNWLNKLVYSWLIDDSNKFCPTESKQWWSTNSARMKVNSTQSLLECIESKNMIFIIVIGVFEHSRWCTWINKQMQQHSEQHWHCFRWNSPIIFRLSRGLFGSSEKTRTLMICISISTDQMLERIIPLNFLPPN